MSQDDSRKPAPAERRSGESKDERNARLEQALRANLRRRKAQSRARADAPVPQKPAGDTE